MYDIFKNVIESTRYDLIEILKKIDTIWVQGDLTDDQKAELVEMAQKHAKPENSYASYDTQIAEIYKKIDNLGETVKANAQGMAALKEAVEKLGGTVVTPTEPEDPEIPAEEYPEYKQPAGAHDAYHVGDKITFDGDHYECIYDGCVWNPVEYPQGWKKVTDSAA